MITSLSGSGSKWKIEVTVDPDEKPVSKTFSSREAAEDWRRDLIQGKESLPASKSAAKKVTARVPRVKLKIAGDLPKADE
jgi:hypothetical protein